MYEIEFYEKTNGECNVWDFLENLRIKSETNKDARIQYKQVTFYIELLRQNGSTLSENIMKHIEDNIWELRPGNNRVFYFFHDEGGKFVLLHHFKKKTQKTPKREIIRAKEERDDYKAREEAKKK